MANELMKGLDYYKSLFTARPGRARARRAGAGAGCGCLKRADGVFQPGTGLREVPAVPASQVSPNPGHRVQRGERAVNDALSSSFSTDFTKGQRRRSQPAAIVKF